MELLFKFLSLNLTLEEIKIIFQVYPIQSITASFILLSLLWILFHTKLIHLILFASFGFLAGYFYFIPINNSQSFDVLSRGQEDQKQQEQNKEQEENLVKLQTCPELDPILNEILDLFIRDFISFWFDPLNVSKLQRFPNQVRSAISVAFMRLYQNIKNFGALNSPAGIDRNKVLLLLQKLSRCIVDTIVYHRQYEESQLNWNEYVKKHTKIKFNDKEFVLRLHEVSLSMMENLLPQNELNSPSLKWITQELISGGLFWPLISGYAQTEYFLQMLLSVIKSSYQHDNQDQSSSFSSQRRVSLRTLQPEAIQVQDALGHNDLFAAFMEYMESINAPAYLRFWTNVDIFKQFSSLQIGEMKQKPESSQEDQNFQVNESIKKDAWLIFEAHFVPYAEMPIKLVTMSTLPKELLIGLKISDRSDADKVDQILKDVHNERVQQLKNILFNDQVKVDCFDTVSSFVKEILSNDYFDGFKKSNKFQDLFQNQHNSNQGQKVTDSIPQYETQVLVQNLGSLDTLASSVNETIQADSDQTKISPQSGDLITTPSEDSNYHSVQVLQQGDADLDENDIVNPDEQALLHLAAAITQLREQHHLIGEKIQELKIKQNQNAVPSLEINSQLKKLTRNQKDLELQMQMLVSSASDMMQKVKQEHNSQEELSNDELQDQSTQIIQRLQLTAVNVSVLDINIVEQSPTSPDNKLFSLYNPVGTLTGLTRRVLNSASNSIENIKQSSAEGSLSKKLKNTVFLIQVEPQSKDKVGWIISRSYPDVFSLHTQLQQLFPKVSKIQVPTLTRNTLNHKQDNSDRLNKLKSDVDHYLKMLIGDQLICESRVMQLFFTPDGGHAGLGLALKNSTPNLKQKSSNISETVKENLNKIFQTLPIVKSPLKKDGQSIRARSSSSVSQMTRNEVSVERGSAPEHIKNSSSHQTLPILIDSGFILITEFFDLNAKNQWLRRKALQVVKSLFLSQEIIPSDNDSQSEIKNKMVDLVEENVFNYFENLCDILNETQMKLWLTALADSLWPLPSRQWYTSTQIIQSQTLSKEKLFDELNEILMDYLENSNDVLPRYAFRLVGRQNSITAFQRILRMAANQDIVKHIFICFLEIIVDVVINQNVKTI